MLGAGVEGVEQDALKTGGRLEAGGLDEGGEELGLEGAGMAAQELETRPAFVARSDTGDDDAVAKGDRALLGGEKGDENGAGGTVLLRELTLGYGEFGEGPLVAQETLDLEVTEGDEGRGGRPEIEAGNGGTGPGGLAGGEASGGSEEGTEHEEIASVGATARQREGTQERKGGGDPRDPGLTAEGEDEHTRAHGDGDSAQAQHVGHSSVDPAPAARVLR
ncbi:MAG: hypothetical protein K0V04_15840 [Deltaproteobacteria bacterium]|nr:hypothetical protein [Deltaproteobacteria bacterium]